MKAARLLPLFGLLAIALVVVCFIVIGETPDTDDPLSKIRHFYVNNDSEVSAGGILMMAAAAAFLIWSVQVRSLLVTREGAPATRATLGMIGSVVFAVGIAIFAGVNISLGDAPEKMTSSTLQTLNVLNEDMFPVMGVGILLTLFGYGLAVLKTRALPAWLGWICVLGGILIFTPVWPGPFIGLALLIIVSSVALAMRGDAVPATGAATG